MPLDPFIAALVEKTSELPALSDGTPEESRARLALGREALGEGPALKRVEDIVIPALGGPLPTRVFYPDKKPKGIVTFLHGGGWVLGGLADFDTYARALAQNSCCVVVMPDYRLAPEAPFPAGLEDSEDTLRWVAENRAHLCWPNCPLVVVGDSAGGNLATVAARRLVNEVQLVLQVLYYPVTDSDFFTPSYRTHGEGLPLKGRDMKWFFGHYAPEALWASPDISPLSSEDLSNLPPSIIVTAEYDVLADEGRAYAQKLRTAGVEVIERELKGFTHGFIRLHNLNETARAELEKVAEEIAAACDRVSADQDGI